MNPVARHMIALGDLKEAELRLLRDPTDIATLQEVIRLHREVHTTSKSIKPPPIRTTIGNQVKPLSRRPVVVNRNLKRERHGWVLGGSPYNRADYYNPNDD